MVARNQSPHWHDATSISLHTKMLLALRRLDDRLLARYRWLVDCIDQIRCEGSCPDVPPSQPLLPLESDLLLSMQALQFDLNCLEHHWEATRQCASPLSGRSLAEQIDSLLDLAETYIARAEVLRRHCWLELSRLDPLDDSPKPWRHRKHADDTELCAQHMCLDFSLLPLCHENTEHDGVQTDSAQNKAKQDHLGQCLGRVLRPTDFVYRLNANDWQVVLTRIRPELIGLVLRRLVSAVTSSPLVGSKGEQTVFKLTFHQENTVAGEHLARCLLRNEGVLIRHAGVKNGARRWRCLP